MTRVMILGVLQAFDMCSFALYCWERVNLSCRNTISGATRPGSASAAARGGIVDAGGRTSVPSGGTHVRRMLGAHSRAAAAAAAAASTGKPSVSDLYKLRRPSTAGAWAKTLSGGGGDCCCVHSPPPTTVTKAVAVAAAFATFNKFASCFKASLAPWRQRLTAYVHHVCPPSYITVKKRRLLTRADS